MTLLATRLGGRLLCAAATLTFLVSGAGAAETGRSANDLLGSPLGSEVGGSLVPSTYVLGPDDEVSIRVIE